ncbi:hypothetical protein ACFS5M_09895 [Lacinutrix iliipiscaria]|uniref:Uncharacterized protein n=1 Tax=Lacinutrix iliipiscaria TaxID=1230532 RepID=A0ABW5WMM1_9FLAO
MPYLQIKNCSTTKEIGTYPQTRGVPRGYTFKWFDQEDSMTNLENDTFPKVIPDLTFEIDDKGKLTDVISPSNLSARGFLFNEQVRKIFNSFHLPNHKIYNALMKHKSEILNYFWLHPVKSDLIGVDFKKSKFIITNFAFIEQSEIDITSEEDYFKKLSALSFKHIRVKQLVLTEAFQRETYDLFFFPYIHSYFFISERMAKSIKESKVSGFSIKEQNIIS